jgi:hypothetical protein
VDDIQPMRALDESERQSWDRWKSVLAAMRSFMPTDAPMLMILVGLDWRESVARKALAGVSDPYDGKRYPALTDLDAIGRERLAILREVGLTAASAKNVRTSKRPKGADAVGEYT